MEDLHITDRSQLRRAHERGAFDRKTINAILDASPKCSIAYLIDGRPYITPTFHWREGDFVYWHGSSASRFLRHALQHEVCFNTFILVGYVMARSGMHHSANYSSVTLFGKPQLVSDEEKEAKLTSFIDMLWPGRSDILRPNSSQELKATKILALRIEEGSAKQRTGGPNDDEADYELPIWAGVISVKEEVSMITDDPKNLPSVTRPDHVNHFHDQKNRAGLTAGQ